jgi:hypothetical protein
MHRKQWTFRDLINTTVLVDPLIVRRHIWVAYVLHDARNDVMLFHSEWGGSFDANGTTVATLETVARIDPTILYLSDLPRGWSARKESNDSLWRRQVEAFHDG